MSLATVSLPQSGRRSLRGSRLQAWSQYAPMTLVNTSFPGYTTVTLGSTAHTKNAWTEVIASLPSAVSAVYVRVGSIYSAGVNTSTLLDFGVGASGSEVAVASNIAVGGHGDTGFWFPLRIASGARVAIRSQSARTSFSYFPRIFFFSSPSSVAVPTAVDILGTSTSTSAGTTLSGASGSWVEITNSTTKDYQSLHLIASASATAAASGSLILSLGSGASGSETVLGSSTWDFSSGVYNPAAVPITLTHAGAVPSGTRLAVRHNIASNPDRWSACIIGVPYV